MNIPMIQHLLNWMTIWILKIIGPLCEFPLATSQMSKIH